MPSKIADNLRKVCFGITAILNTVFPIIYYTSGSLPQEVIIGVNFANSIMILIAERSNTIEKSIQQMNEDIRSLSGASSSRSVVIPVVSNVEPIQETEPIPQTDTSRGFQRVRPVLNRHPTSLISSIQKTEKTTLVVRVN